MEYKLRGAAGEQTESRRDRQRQRQPAGASSRRRRRMVRRRWPKPKPNSDATPPRETAAGNIRPHLAREREKKKTRRPNFPRRKRETYESRLMVANSNSFEFFNYNISAVLLLPVARSLAVDASTRRKDGAKWLVRRCVRSSAGCAYVVAGCCAGCCCCCLAAGCWLLCWMAVLLAEGARSY